MNISATADWIAFSQGQQIAQGQACDVAGQVKAFFDAHPERPLLIVDAHTGQTVELDLRGPLASVLQQLQSPTPSVPSEEAATEESPRGPGRPRLGVVGREVTLLPRHWDWLASQPGGASVALRKIVERAKKESADADRRRQAVEVAYRFMSLLGGSEPGFEEASRALFAGDLDKLQREVAYWPEDVRKQVLSTAGRALPSAAETPFATE